MPKSVTLIASSNVDYIGVTVLACSQTKFVKAIFL